MSVCITKQNKTYCRGGRVSPTVGLDDMQRNEGIELRLQGRPNCNQSLYRLRCPGSSLRHNKQTPWPLVRKRTVPTEPPTLAGEF
jgi:hypothetical protein